MKKILFENSVLVSTKNGSTPFHDDMLGENVWVNLNYNPYKSDWREFNGIRIDTMAEILKDFDDEMTTVQIDMTRKIIKARRLSKSHE